MKRIAILFLLSHLSVCSVWAEPEVTEEYQQEHLRWIEGIFRETRTIDIGMTRKDLLRIFTKDVGGFRFRKRTAGTYVYEGCPYIKVDVEFRPVGNEKDLLAERPEDVIEKISRPYLELSILD